MLYITTRSDHDTYTAQRALKESAAPDGGLYLPMRWGRLSPSEIRTLLEAGNPEICAAILNYSFSLRLTARDAEFVLGKRMAVLKQMSHRITVAECWRNPEGEFTRTERIMAKLAAVDKRQTPVGQWLKVVSRICLLFCLFAEMDRQGGLPEGTTVDTVVGGGDFTGPVAAWYAREMGLPVGNILYCGKDAEALWDLLQTGQLRLDRTNPAAPGMEQLIRICLGAREARSFASAVDQERVYQLGKGISKPFEGLQASVIRDQRIPGIISNVYATNGYVLGPESAVLYAGLMDYRARAGSGGAALIVSQTSPVHGADTVAQALDLTKDQLQEHLNRM